MFHNVAEDDRSDNDDVELAEEQRLDALAHEARLAREKAEENVDAPQVLVNGTPLKESSGKASGAETRTNGKAAKGRKANGKANGKAS